MNCPHCPQVFTSRRKLRRHLTSVHWGKYRSNGLASQVVKRLAGECPYCEEAIQRLGEDFIDTCPTHGVLEGEPAWRV